MCLSSLLDCSLPHHTTPRCSPLLASAFYTCDRIFTTPIPLMYTRHTARFLLIWLLAMPMSLYHEFRRAEKIAIPLVVPVISFFSAIFLFGIEVTRVLFYLMAALMVPLSLTSLSYSCLPCAALARG